MAKVDLGTSLTIAEVGEKKASMQVALGSADRIEIVASDVDQVDGAGMQLLAACVREARSRSIEVSLSGMPQHMKDAARLLGLESTVLANGS